MEILAVSLNKPAGANIILGQAHFIKTVEDLHEALVTAVAGIRFGVAFCEASPPALIRSSGTSPAMLEAATECARQIAAGHAFVVVLENAFPINVLNAIKAVPEVCTVFCATANDVQVVLAQTESGRAILGVVDGISPRGVEQASDVEDRRTLLRRFGYKL